MAAVTTTENTENPTAGTTEQHGLKQHTDGAWNVIPLQTRSERFASTNHDDFAAVTGLEAEWKLTPVDKVRPLIDGSLDGAPYPVLYNEAVGTSVEWIDRSDARVGSAGTAEERASANAWTNFEKALSITVAGEESETLTVTRGHFGATERGAHTVITAKPQSSGLVIMQGSGDARLSENVEIVVEEGANLTVVTVQEWNDESLHLASHFARVARDGKLKHIIVSLGGAVVRVNPSAHLAEAGAEAELYGVYFADAGQHLEQRVYVNHDAPHTRSRVNYKGALNGAGARTVWVGDVLIGRTAPGTDSYEQNRNLVLSDGTRADSIPNLEIETGDIEGAGHASATGRFDDEQLFYLRARGITEHEARRLVVIGFLAEIVQKIGDRELEHRLGEAIEAELANAERG